MVDPQPDIEPYLEAAAQKAMRITHIFETHVQADHVSGARRLAAATGAPVLFHESADVRFPHVDLEDGEEHEMGNVHMTILHTPGHTPDSVSIVVSDRSRAPEPWFVLTGDTLFSGGVGRPDLLGAGAETALAEQLYDSVFGKLMKLPDHIEIFPAHFGGAACGKGLSGKPGSTIGFERRFNRLLRLDDENEFVRELTADLAPQPPNFKRIVELNRGPLLEDAPALDGVAPHRVQELLDSGATLLDGRPPREFDAQHVPGSVNVTMARSAVGTRAAWVVDPESDVVVIAETDAEARRMGRLLEAVGLRRLAGYLAGGVNAWQEAGLETGSTPAIDVHELADRIKNDSVALLDVREEDEWQQGHVEGSIHVPYHELREGAPASLRLTERECVVVCSVGNRSSIAASLLRRSGVDNVIHVADGGVADLEKEGIPLVEGK